METESALVKITDVKARRRSSLFQTKGNEEVLSMTITHVEHNYPPHYVLKLEEERNKWDQMYREVHSQMVEKKQELLSEKIHDHDILSAEQLDFLASVMDYEMYLQKVTDFTNRVKMAMERNELAKQEIQIQQEDLDEMNKKMLKAVNQYF